MLYYTVSLGRFRSRWITLKSSTDATASLCGIRLASPNAPDRQMVQIKRPPL